MLNRNRKKKLQAKTKTGRAPEQQNYSENSNLAALLESLPKVAVPCLLSLTRKMVFLLLNTGSCIYRRLQL
jgi:hypothetical protein